MGSYENVRKYKRIRITSLAKLNNAGCAVLNVSREGLLVATDIPPEEKHVEVQLKIKGRWSILHGTIMWAMDGPNPTAKRIGVCITEAPLEYKEFIDNLYIEADESES